MRACPRLILLLIGTSLLAACGLTPLKIQSMAPQGGSETAYVGGG